MTSPSDLFDLHGKVALVTGGTRGIGAAVSKMLAEAGASVWIGGRSLEAARMVADTLQNATPVELDVSDGTSVKAAIMAIRKEAGQLDVLVNNAGIMRPATLAMSREADLDDMMATNVKGSLMCAQLAARLMATKKSGAIINLASIMGVNGAPGYTSYSATKAAVIGMTKAMSKELAPLGIRVNAIAPGFIESNMTDSIEGANRAVALDSIGMKRFGTQQDVAAASLFLASSAASYITGQVLGVDGSMQV